MGDGMIKALIFIVVALFGLVASTSAQGWYYDQPVPDQYLRGIWDMGNYWGLSWWTPYLSNVYPYGYGGGNPYSMYYYNAWNPYQNQMMPLYYSGSWNNPVYG